MRIGRPGFWRVTLAVAGLLLVLLGLAAEGPGAGRPAVAGERSAGRLVIGKGERVAVFAPHPDDETLGAGGVIQEVLRRGGRVRVVIMTNGDGFRLAAERNLHKVRPAPADFLTLGRLREEEALRAAAALALDPDRVTFLGFPDRGLARLWTNAWGAARYRSGYTGADAVPYARARRPGAPYNAESLVGQIREILREERPDRIFVPAAFDNHPDHWATGLFVAYALAEAQAAGEGYAERVRLYTYVIHAPGWPSPFGLDTLQAGGRPPLPRITDSPWVRFTLGPEQAAAKERAIGAYRSQVAVMSRFLYSFSRSDEVFQELPAKVLPQAGADWRAMFRDGMATLVEGSRPGARELSARYWGKSLISGSLAGAADGEHLYLRLRSDEAVAAGTAVRFDLVGAGGEAAPGRRRRVVITVDAAVGRDGRVRQAVHGARWSLSDGTLLLAVPRRALGGAGTVFVSVRLLRRGQDAGMLPWVFCALDGM